PKSGFYYVIDRETGKLISAKPMMKVTWTKGIDPATGYPIDNPEARYPTPAGAVIWPRPVGFHSAQPMSYSPQTGLTYIPSTEAAHFVTDAGIDIENWKPHATGQFSGGIADAGVSEAPPPSPLPDPIMALTAWNPQTQTKAWSAPMPPHWGGGVMSTA